MYAPNENEGPAARTARDFMCYPQLVDDPFRDKGETFAQALRSHIEFSVRGVSDGHPIDPNDPGAIY